jgi:hypothetical protein
LLDGLHEKHNDTAMSGAVRQDAFPGSSDETELDEGVTRVDDTLARIRAALLQDQLRLGPGLAPKAKGADPYNNGVFRAPARGDAWGTKRPR